MVVYGVTVGDIIGVKGSDVITIRPDQTLHDAARVLHDRRIGIVVVKEAGGKVVGVLSERDVVRAMAAHGAEAAGMAVADYMTRKVIVCRPFDHPKAVVESMKKNRIRHMPVVNDGRLVGLVSIGDLLKHLLDHHEIVKEADVLQKLGF